MQMQANIWQELEELTGLLQSYYEGHKDAMSTAEQVRFCAVAYHPQVANEALALALLAHARRYARAYNLIQ